MLMLDLVRHGQALPTSPTGDPGRPLSPAGEAAVRDLAAALAGHGFRPDRIFASPLARAQQTARLLAAAAAPPPEVETLAELVPEHVASEVLHALRAHGADAGHVVLVGHMPQLTQVYALLTKKEVSFSTGTLRRVECRDGPRPGRGDLILTLP